MAEDFKNKIQRLELENFTCFAKAEMDFSSGINVFIGENGTGKTHVLKVLNSFSCHLPAEPRASNPDFPPLNSASTSLGIMQSDSLSESFKSFGSNLLRKESPLFKVEFVSNNGIEVKYNLVKSENGLSYLPKLTYSELTQWWKELFPLFIPTNEMLSFYRGFVEGYEKRENYFDVSYYRLAKALAPLPLKEMPQKMKNLIEDLEKFINGKVFQKNNSFHIEFDDEKKPQESVVIATGINKLAQMIYLIKNGSLTTETILFWDEPEVNLNPKYIKIIAKFLQTLAKNGVQIFVATHDYLLAHLLSLDAEYSQETAAPPMKFFSFYKGEDGTKIEAADTIAGLQHNALLDEYAAYYDLEQALFRKSMQNV